MLKVKVNFKLGTVGGWCMRYQLLWPAIKGCGYCTVCVQGLLHAYRVGRTRDGHTTCLFSAVRMFD